MAALAALLAGGCAALDAIPLPAPDLPDIVAAIDTDPSPDGVEVWLTATTGTFEYLPGKKAHV